MESASTGKPHNFGACPKGVALIDLRRNWQAFQTHPLTKIFMPWWKSSRAIFCEPSPPTVRTASMASFFESALAPSETSRTVSWPFLDGSLLEGITAIRGAQDSAVARQDTADVFERELARLLRPEQAVEAVGDANDFRLMLENGRFDDSAEDGVEAGRVTAARTDADGANVGHANEGIVCGPF